MIGAAFGAPSISAGVGPGEWLAFAGTIAVVVSGIVAARWTSGAARDAASISAKARGQETYYDRVERRLSALEAWQDAAFAGAQEHAGWDHNVTEALREQGLPVEDPPPILPPRRAYRPDEE